MKRANWVKFALHDRIPSVLGSFHDCALPVVQNLSNAEHSAEEIFGNVTVESELDGANDGAFLVGVLVGSARDIG